MIHVWASNERLTAAQGHYRSCQLCEHRCGVDRHTAHIGPCKAGVVPNIFRCRVEYGDERELVPSLLVYLSGCDLRCGYCINELNAFDPKRGRPLTAEFLQDAIDAAVEEGAKTLQWVGGEPTIHLPAILEAMTQCRIPLRVIWKTDLYATPEALGLLNGVVDVYLADFKFGNDACALRIAKVERYTGVLQRNLRQVASQGDLIIRHLLLPGHHDCCVEPIVSWIRDQMPAAKVSLRDGYLPHWQAGQLLELARPLDRSESKHAHALALQAGLKLVP